MNAVNATTLDRLGIDHAVYRRVRQACGAAAAGISVDEHALHVALTVSAFRHATTKTGPAGASPAVRRANGADKGER